MSTNNLSCPLKSFKYDNEMDLEPDSDLASIDCFLIKSSADCKLILHQVGRLQVSCHGSDGPAWFDLKEIGREPGSVSAFPQLCLDVRFAHFISPPARYGNSSRSLAI